MRIDLHDHTTCSDGMATPTELIDAAVAAGLDVVAITDHDTTEGWAEARAAASGAGIELAPGIEISCKIRETSLHLLGYFFDPSDAALNAELVKLRDGRVLRAQRMVEKCIALGAPITWERVRAIAGGVVGRPHIASALIEAGLVADINEAFGPEWIGHEGRAHVAKYDLDPLLAISLVTAAGGVTVMAHPFAQTRGPNVEEADVAAFAAAGLTGIEMDHPDQDAAARDHVRGLAKELGLLTTGSSDWHGSRKPTPIGAETTDPEVYAALRAAATYAAG